MQYRGLRARWPFWAMRAGSVLGAAGMVGGQIAQGATAGQVVFTVIIAVVFVFGVWMLAANEERRMARSDSDRAPIREPLKLAVVGLLIIAIVMWLTAAYGTFIAAVTTPPENKWHAVAYVGVALAATGATFMVRRARTEWERYYLSGWPDPD